MDVTLLGNYPPDEQESMLRLAGMLERLLIQNGYRVEVIRPEPFFGRLRRSSQGIGKWLGYIDKFILFPFALRSHIRRRKKAAGGRPFLVHICDHSNAMYTRWLADVPHIVNCHDLMAIQSARGLIPQHKTKWPGRVLQSWILSGLRRADYVICVSEETRNDLLSLAPELKSRSRTIENGLNHPYAPMPPDEALRHLSRLGLDAETRFIFHIGGNQWYKNREAVIRIFGLVRASSPELTGSLVMAGKPPTDALRHLVEEENLAGRVIFLTSVSNEQLCALYSRAEALLFPSLKEGFGWPIIEAQACGCPVITSDRPPMSRLGGPAALLADPQNPVDFAERLRELLSEEPAARQRRQTEALYHARRYDPETFVKEMLLAYAYASCLQQKRRL